MRRSLACMAFAVIATMMLAGCGESSPSGTDTTPDGADRLLPLALGNRWIYETTIYDSTGKATLKADTTLVAGDTTIQGERWFFFNDDRATPTVSRTDGVYYWDTRNNASRLYVRYPGAVGESYERGSQRYTIVATNTTVTVPAGVFTCYQIRLTDQNIPGLDATLSIAPGTGTIKIEAINTRPDGTRLGSARMELKAYTLK